MSRPEPLSRQQFSDLVEAIMSAFPSEEDLDLLVQLKLGLPLGHITRRGKQEFMVKEVVAWAKARGLKLDELVVGAMNRNPDNPQLRAVAKQLVLDEGAENFEAYVLDSAPPEDVDKWRELMMTNERAVCRIEGPKYGTGFLVGPGMVLTNYHVMDTVIDDEADPEDIVVRFDYKKKGGGETIQDGVEYRLVSGSRWLAASSPRDKLDYALLRVEGSPERGRVAGQDGAPVRGHLTPQAVELQEGDPLFIIQHPERSPLKFALGFVRDKAENHVHYKVNTAQGSSGAPCFSAEWQPVALHHWGSEDEKINRGIVLSAVMEDWRQKGLERELKYLKTS